MSGGKKTKTTSTLAPSAEYKGYIDSAASQIQPAFQTAQANNAGLLERVNSAIPALTGRFGESAGYYSDVLGGKYLDGNPYLSDMIDQTGRSVADRVNSAIGSRGQTGGSAHAGILSRQLADSENALRYNDYSAERTRMGEAAAGLGSTAAGEGSLLALLTGLSSDLPQAASSRYADTIASLLGKYATENSTTKQSGGLLGSLLGAGATLGAAAICDARLKRDIERIGATDEGIPLYRFRYFDDEAWTIGPMAQEVAEMKPEALGPEIDGYMTIYPEAL